MAVPLVEDLGVADHAALELDGLDQGEAVLASAVRTEADNRRVRQAGVEKLLRVRWINVSAQKIRHVFARECRIGRRQSLQGHGRPVSNGHGVFAQGLEMIRAAWVAPKLSMRGARGSSWSQIDAAGNPRCFVGRRSTPWSA